MIPQKTIPSLLINGALQSPNHPILFEKKRGAWKPMTYAQLLDNCALLHAQLIKLKIAPGDKVAILSTNSPKWVVADLSIMAASAAVVPIYPTLSPEETRYILDHSGAKAVFVEDNEQAKKVLSVMENLSNLKTIILFKGRPSTPSRRVIPLSHPVASNYALRASSDKSRHPSQEGNFFASKDTNSPSRKGWMTERSDGVVSFQELLKEKVTAKQRAEFQKYVEKITPNDIASIVYTSGTTGIPKGVLLSHENFMTNVSDILQVFDVSKTDRMLSILPLSHVFERTTGYYCALAAGIQIYYAESLETVRNNMLEVKPTIVIGVPRLYEKLEGRILDNAKGLKKYLFHWAMRIGAQKNPPKLEYAIAKHLVFSKVQAKMGGKLRFFVSGGAPLAKEVGRFFASLGILIVEGYGQTEAAPVIACNRPNDNKIGTVGKALPSVQVKLAEDGELLVKGPSIMTGYYQNDTETKLALDSDGWLHTGDIAKIDSEGHIQIVDRKKEIIVLSTGKKVAPTPIEEAIKRHPYVSQVILIGDTQKYISALIVPNFDKLTQAKIVKEQSPYTYIMEPKIQQAFRQIIATINHHLAAFEQVKQFRLLPTEFSAENGEITPTLKLKRAVILSHYQDIVHEMYHISTPR